MRALKWLAIFIFISGLIACSSLLTIPADPKNAWLLGYSATRWGLVALLLVISSAPLIILLRLRGEADKLHVFMTVNRRSTFQRGATGLLLAGIVYQLYVPFITRADQAAILERFHPLIGWGLFSVLLILIFLLVDAGKLLKPVSTYIKPVVNFFAKHPAFVYFAVGVTLIILAQINDKGWLKFSQYLRFPNSEISNWDLLTEEIFETAAAFEFIAASLIGFLGERQRRLTHL